MSKHSEHKFGSLDEKAAEIKTKVFESLSEFEYEEKLMNAVKAEIVQKIEKHENEQKTLRETAVAELEKLKEEVLKTIDDNCNIMKEHLKAVDDVVEIQQKLRDLLSVSNDHLVNEFKKIDKKMKQLRIAGDKMKKEKAVVHSFDVGCVVEKVKKFQDSLTADLKSNVSVSYFCWSLSGTGYRVTSKKWKIFVEDAAIDDSGSLSYTDRKTQVLNEEVTHCFSVLDTSNILKILILTSNNSAYIFNPSDANMTISTVSYPAKNNFLWPYYAQAQVIQEPHWSYWEGDMIKFTHDASFSIQCETIPSVRMGQYHWNWLTFITPNKTVLLADIRSNKESRFTIPDIGGINSVSFMHPNALSIFAADGNSFHTVYWVKHYYFSDPVKHNWDNQSRVVNVSVDNVNYSIVKAANPSDSLHPYLFNVIKTWPYQNWDF